VRWRRLLPLGLVLWYLALGGLLWTWPVAGDDAYAHSVMAVEQAGCWRQGVVWPRFHPDWNGGTGSFLPSVYAPLTLAAEGAACIVAGEGTRAVGLVLVVSLLTGALLLDASLKTRGLQGGGAWAVTAYPLTAILARATTTELMALALAGPVLVLGAPPGPRSRRQGVALAGALALVSGCQMGMVLMLGLVLGAAWLVELRSQWREGVGTALWLGAGLAAGGVFWWPAIRGFRWMDRGALLGGQYDWRSHHALALGSNGELGPVLLAVFISLVAAAVWLGVGGGERRGWISLLAGLAACLWLATPLAAPVWHLLPGLESLQFPWRFLGPASILALAGATALRGNGRLVVLALLVVPVAWVPVELHTVLPRLETGLDGAELGRRAGAVYGMAPVLPSMPGFHAPGFSGISSLRALESQRAIVERGRGAGCFPRSFVVQTPEEGPVLLPVQWWPELELHEGGKELAFENRKGLVSAVLGGGVHELELSLAPPRSRWEGAAISAAGLLLLGGLWVVRRKLGQTVG